MNLPTENIFGHTKKLEYILSAVNEVVSREPTATIMDFGCGNGEAVSQYIIDRLPKSARYIGVDLHEPSVEHANRRFSAANATFQTTESTEQVDLIVYADILEHLDNPEQILARHAQLLRRDGLAVGSIPNGVGPFELESALDRKFRISNRIAGMMAKGRGRVERTP